MTSLEHELVLASVRVDGQPVERIAQILGQGVDWKVVRSIAQQHRVLPLLYHWMVRHGAESVPPAEIAVLRSFYQSNALLNLRKARSLVHLVEILSGQRIECLCFKGPALALQIYGDIALRQSVDLDILVRKNDLPGAYLALAAASFTPDIPLGTLNTHQIARANKHLGFHRGEEMVELHGEILEGGMAYPVPEEYFWSGSGRIDLLNRPVPVFSPEANLLMLAMQAAGDGWDILKWVADLAHCCRFSPPPDWLAFLMETRRMGVSRLIHLALLLATDMGGASLPQEVVNQCRADRGAIAMVGEVTTRLKSKPQPEKVNGLVFYLRSREHLRHRLYYVMDQSFVPKQVDWQTFRLPNWISFAYYLLRPLRLAVKFILSALRK